jgi:hypothetical protein
MGCPTCAKNAVCTKEDKFKEDKVYMCEVSSMEQVDHMDDETYLSILNGWIRAIGADLDVKEDIINRVIEYSDDTYMKLKGSSIAQRRISRVKHIINKED